MARVRQHGTAPELVVRTIARSAGLDLRTNGKALPGSPDLFCMKPPRAVFVHGCFWHRHPGCSAASTPKAHRDFWVAKFIANVARDERKVRQLREQGFRVMTIWECEVRRGANIAALTRRLVRFFRSTLTP
jgi:DNA mismatch endonuclease (patch repair protein)